MTQVSEGEGLWKITCWNEPSVSQSVSASKTQCEKHSYLKPVLWHSDTADVFWWQEAVAVEVAEGRGAAGGGEEENRGEGIIVKAFLSSLPQCRSQIPQGEGGDVRGEEREMGGGGGFPTGPRRPALWLSNERRTAPSALRTLQKPWRIAISFSCQESGSDQHHTIPLRPSLTLNSHFSFAHTHTQTHTDTPSVRSAAKPFTF